MLKRFILASALAGGALAAGPQAASAANFGPAPAVTESSAGLGATTVQYGYYGYGGPRFGYYRPRPYYRPYGYYRPRPFYRPYGYYYRPRPFYRPFY